jgi:hypothetical protein
VNIVTDQIRTLRESFVEPDTCDFRHKSVTAASPAETTHMAHFEGILPGHCGLYARHFEHRFFDPIEGIVYRCRGRARVPWDSRCTRDPWDAPQYRHGVRVG